MPIGLYAIPDRGINIAFERRLGLQNPDATLSLSPELSAVIPIDSSELQYHLGWRRYMSSGNIAAGGAATFATVQYRMPRTANTVAVIEGVWFGTTAAEVVVSGIISTTDQATLIGAQVRDTREPATKPGSGIVSTTAGGQNAIGGGGVYSIQSNVLPPIFPLIVLPSTIAPATNLDGYSFQAQTANQAYDFCIVYRERTLNDQENSQ